MPYIWVPKSIANPNPNPNSNQIPKSIKNPNPNPNFTPITQPSSSNPPKFNPNHNKKYKKRRNKPRKPKNKTQIKPNWLDLPEDIWFVILSRLYTIELIENVQKVCRFFRRICIQPCMFRIIDMNLPDDCIELEYDVNALTRFAVDRSKGELVDISLGHCADGETIMYIVDRSKNLKNLRIAHHDQFCHPVLIEAVQKVPMLEELEIILCDYSADDTIEKFGHACTTLKSFSLNYVGSKQALYVANEDAFDIARNMPNLHRLQLIGNELSNEGLKAILDGCPLLESLDLRACLNIDLSKDLGKRCDKIKHFRRPTDSTADYRYKACTDDDETDYCCWADQPEIEYGSDDFGMPDFYSGHDYDDFEMPFSYPGHMDYPLDPFTEYFVGNEVGVPAHYHGHMNYFDFDDFL